VKNVLESSLTIPNADFDIFIAESMTWTPLFRLESGEEGEGGRCLGGVGFEGEFIA
jgi:hypothetical protein